MNKLWTSHLKMRVLQVSAVGLLALPLVSANCTSTASRIFRVDQSGPNITPVQSNPLSRAELDRYADDFSLDARSGDERSVPWRRGVAYEAISQSLSIFRAVAISLGWNARTELPGNFTLSVEDAALSSAQIIDKYDLDLPSSSTDPKRVEFETIMQDLKKVRQSAPLSQAQQLNAVLAIGDDVLDSTTLNVNSYFNVTYNGFDFRNTFYQEIQRRLILTNSRAALYPHPIKVAVYNEVNAPGRAIMNVRVNGTPYSRNLIINNASPAYPVLNDVVMREIIAPLMPPLIRSLDRFLTSFGSQFTPLFLAPDLISILQYLANYIKTDDGGSIAIAKWNGLMQALNNGSHHLLALVAFYCGFDQSFIDGELSLYNAYNAGLQNWSSGYNYGLQAMSSDTDLVRFTGWPSVSVGAGLTTNLQYLNNVNLSGRLAYFSSQSSDNLLAKNLVQRVNPNASQTI